MHTTFTEAVEVAKNMKAKHTIMTHFSQRYAKCVTLDEFEDHENVGVAFDFLSVNPKTIKAIHKTYPALKLVYKEAMDLVYKRSDPVFNKRIDEAVAASLKMVDDNDEKDRGQKRKKSFAEYTNAAHARAKLINKTSDS